MYKTPRQGLLKYEDFALPLLAHRLGLGLRTSTFNKQSLRNSELDFSYDNWEYLNLIFNQMLL